MKEKTFQEFDIPLHDIKPLIEVEEYSLYYLIGLVGLGILVTSIVIYFLYKWYKKSKAYNIRVSHNKHMQTLDLEDTKNTAYAISTYGITFVKDSQENESKYEELSQSLQEYKYKKSVAKFDEKTIGLIEEYKAMIHV